MNALTIYENMQWLISEKLITMKEYHGYIDTLGQRLTDSGFFIGGLSDLQIIHNYLKIN